MLWKIQGRLSVLETQVTPLWSSLQRDVSQALHHPHPESKEMDDLLEKLELLTISKVEREKLIGLLRAIVNDESQTKEERNHAELLLFIMPRVLLEAAEDATK